MMADNANYVAGILQDAAEARKALYNDPSAQSAASDVAAIRATIAFLASVIHCGEPFTATVAEHIDDAFFRLNRLLNDGVDDAR